VIGFEEGKTFKQSDTELAVIRLSGEVFPYLRNVSNELCNLHFGTVWKSIRTMAYATHSTLKPVPTLPR
jgi:hypothetical protein